MESTAAVYKRQGAKGKLTLGATLDVAEAALLHAASLQALQDAKAETVTVDASKLEALDLSSIQILMALRNAVSAENREFVTTGLSPTLRNSLDSVGISLD